MSELSGDSRPVDILLVEDDPNDAELALRALRKHNVANRIEVAHDGVEALEYLQPTDGRPPNGYPRVVLLDLKLPRIDGMEVLRRLKQSPETRRIPIVVLTSSGHERDLLTSYELGVNSYIQKPLDFEQFVRVVGELGLYWLVLNRLPE